MDKDYSGYVYILSNPAMPGILKIGRSIKGGHSRAKEIYRQGGTGVPVPFNLVFEVYSDFCALDEKKIHGNLSSYRINKNREFFKINSFKAIECVLSVVCSSYDLHVGQADSVVTAHDLINNYGEKTKSLIKEIFPYGTQEMNLASAVSGHLDIYSVIGALHKYRRECERRRKEIDAYLTEKVVVK